VLISSALIAQPPDALIRKGNRNYKAQAYDQSKADYESALKKSPANTTAHFNLGNTEFRKNDYEGAASSYDEVLKSNTDVQTQNNAWYNKGVALQKQNKLEESIDAWKHALELNPEDQEARENLTKALLEKRKKEQQQQNNNKDKKEQKPKQDKKNQQQKEEQKNSGDNRPKPQQSKLSKQQVEQYLRSLIQREKDVQDKMNQQKTRASDQPDKDW
jgi:tetratricopeptide (TPR) repeat protein